MYTSFHIKNYRCFDDLALTDLGRVNLIAGKNNVGKTALLEAILIHSGKYDAVLSRMELKTNLERQIAWQQDDFRISGIHGWNTLFYGFNSAKEILISGQSEDQKQLSLPIEGFNSDEVAISIISLDKIPEAGINRRIQRYIADNEPMPEDLEVLQFTAGLDDYHLVQHKGRIIRDRFFSSSASRNVIFLASREKVSLEEDAERFSFLKRLRQIAWLVETLHIVEPRLVNIDLLANGIHGDIEGIDQLIPLSTMGDGVGRLASLVMAIGTLENGILLIDEIENGLHYSVLVDVWKAIAQAARTFNVQIFATTHSLEMIRAAHEAFSQSESYDFRLHQLGRDTETGQIEALTFNQNSMNAAILFDQEVRG